MEEFRKLRERVEAQWDIDVKDKSKSSFDISVSYSDGWEEA